LALFWLIPRIERETALFRVLWLMIFAAVSAAVVDGLRRLPPWPFIGFTLLEIAVRRSSSPGKRVGQRSTPSALPLRPVIDPAAAESHRTGWSTSRRTTHRSERCPT
jgi:hypothetical protein